MMNQDKSLTTVLLLKSALLKPTVTPLTTSLKLTTSAKDPLANSTGEACTTEVFEDVLAGEIKVTRDSGSINFISQITEIRKSISGKL